MTTETSGEELSADDALERRDASQARLRLVLDNVDDVVVQYDLDGTIEWVSPSVRRVLGWTPEELTGTRNRIDVESARDSVEAAHDAALARGQDSYSQLVEVRRADGSTLWADCRTRIVRDEDGHPVGLVTGLRDATRQVAAERRLMESESRYRLLAENCEDFVALADVHGVITWVSPSVTDATGWHPSDLVGHAATDFMDPASRADIVAGMERVLAGEPRFVRRRIRRADGTFGWFTNHSRAARTADGSVTGIVATFRDVTTEVESEAALAEADVRYRLLAENSTDVVAHTGADGLVAWVSPSLTTVLGWGADDVVGRRLTELMHPEDVSAMAAFISESVAAGRTAGRTEARFAVRGGGWRWMSVGGRALFDDDGALVGGIDSLRDIQAEHEAREELRREANRDPLTGLANRRQLRTRLSSMLSHLARDDRRTALMLVDVDRLKAINDTFGHAVGDEVLVEIGQRLDAVVDELDLVGRYGGDEFLALLSLNGLAEGATLAQRMHDELSRPVTVEDHRIDVGLSIGLAIERPGDTADSLVRRADAALYRAKVKGRSRTETDEDDA